MVIIKKGIQQGEEQEWENPINPEGASDARDDEQMKRQFETAKRLKDNLTVKEYIDKKQGAN